MVTRRNLDRINRATTLLLWALLLLFIGVALLSKIRSCTSEKEKEIIRQYFENTESGLR